MENEALTLYKFGNIGFNAPKLIGGEGTRNNGDLH